LQLVSAAGVYNKFATPKVKVSSFAYLTVEG